jgi:hypothetical protein
VDQFFRKQIKLTNGSPSIIEWGQVTQILGRKEVKTLDKKEAGKIKGLKRVTEVSVENAKSIKGGKTCNCSCQTQNEKAATTLSTFTS